MQTIFLYLLCLICRFELSSLRDWGRPHHALVIVPINWDFRLWALLSEIAIYTDIYRNLPISVKSSIRIAIYRLIMINHDCFFDNCANITRKVTNLSQIFVIFRYIWHVSKIQTRYRENMNEFYRYLVITWIRDRFRYLSIKLVGNCGRYRYICAIVSVFARQTFYRKNRKTIDTISMVVNECKQTSWAAPHCLWVRQRAGRQAKTVAESASCQLQVARACDKTKRRRVRELNENSLRESWSAGHKCARQNPTEICRETFLKRVN